MAMQNAGGEFLYLPKSVGHRRVRRLRPEDDLRLREETPFDRAHPWIRIGFGRGTARRPAWARLSPANPSLMEVVPDDGEAVLVPVSRTVRRRLENQASKRADRGLKPVVLPFWTQGATPPADPDDSKNDWWARIQPDGTVRHIRASAKWVAQQTALADPEKKRRAAALERKRQRSR